MVRMKVLLFALLLATSSLFASSYQQITTEHTQIIFEAYDYPYAQEVAAFADEVFEELTGFLAHTPNDPVPVVITSKTAWANGYYINFPSAVYLYVTSPDDRFIGSRTQNWLRSLFIHELTHYIHLTSAVGPAKFLRFLGPEITAMSTAFMPGWWIEGVTTYAETAFVSSGGRGDSLPFARIYQTSLAQDSMWSLTQGAYNGPFNPSDRIYVTGYVMIDYLSRHYGLSAFAEINRRFAALPFFGLTPAFKKVTGHSAKEIFSFALQEREKVSLSLDGLIAKPIQGDRFLPASTSIGLIGFVQSPDEGRAVYRYTEDGSTEKILELSLDGGSALSFAQDSAVFSSLWADATHPSSLSLASVSYSDLYLLDLASLKARRLTHEQRLVQPAISRDGSRIVASSVNGSFYDLVELDDDTLEITTLASQERVSFLQPALNHDGSAVVYVAMEQGNSSLYLLEEGKKPLLLVGPTADELRSPRFTDNDSSVLFIKELQLYQYRLDTGEIHLVHTDPVGIYNASLVGHELFYETYTAQGFAVKKVELKNPSIEQVTFRAPLAGEGVVASVTYPKAAYYDSLQFNIALPFPFVEANQFQPGVWFHTTSLLRKQSLIGSVGWSIRGAKPVTDLTYAYTAGSYAVALGLELNTYLSAYGSYVSYAYSALQFPLISHTTYYSFEVLNLQPQLSLAWNESGFVATGALLLGYGKQTRNERTADFFGPPSFSVSGGVMVQSNTLEPVPFLSTDTQVRLFDSSAMLHFGLDVIGTTSLNVSGNFTLFSFTPMQDGNVKLRLSTSFRFPLGLLDIPIPYGGLTGVGLELITQSAWYLNAEALVWEGATALAARLTSNAILGGSSVAFRPFAQFAYLLGPGLWQFSLGLDGQTLFESFSFR